jgi:hypothetical protein
MASGDISTANIGTPWPLSYGYFRATGMRLIDFTVLPTTAVPAGTFPANMQIGMWDLGEGELDGCDALWINDILQFAFDPHGNLMGSSLVGVVPADLTTTPTLTAFWFHTGCDAPIGSSTASSGTTQQIDPLWSYIGDLVTPLCFSRRSYYAIGWTPATNDSSTLSPLADFRGMRCRIFDGAGNCVNYGFTTNPIWHFVDLWLRRAIKPEYAIPQGGRPDDLTADESSRFNWPSIYAAATYCDQILANGLPRFSGSYVFSSGSTLQAMLEQVLLCCRGYMYEYAGQIYVFVDQPRPSTFTVSAKHLVPGSFEVDDTQVNQNANRYVGQFLELGLPAVAKISTISRTATEVVIDTVNPNPCGTGDIISVGGVADPSFDASYEVTSTPSDTQVDITISGGVAASSTGGSIGYIQSRFSQRNPEISHIQHQLAQGQIFPPNVTGTRLKRIKVSYDFASMTYDQAMRLLQYEIYRDLGLDTSPYQPPWGLTLSLFSESVDTQMRSLKAQLVGAVITLDSTVFFEYAGDYEIMERYFNPIQEEIEDSTDGSFVQPTTRSGAMAQGTDSNSGILKLVLRTFNPSATIFTDVSVAANSSFATVPGQLPYGGGGLGSVGTASTLTVSTDSTGLVTASWTTVQVTLTTGIVLTYTAGSATHVSDLFGTLGAIAPGSACFLFVEDVGATGGSGKILVGFGQAYSPTPPPNLVVTLTSFIAPVQPPSGSAPNVNTYPIS